MWNLRKKIFIISGIVVGIILAFLLLYFFVFKNGGLMVKEAIKSVIPTKSTTVVEEPVNQVIVPVIKPAADPDGLYAKQLARDFVERFISYSNQDGNKHISDVLPLVTDQMAAWMKKQTVDQSSIYHGFSAKVVAMSLKERTPEKAVVSISVQILEQTTTSSNYLQRDGEVNLVKVGNDWKVDGFYWNK